MLNFPDSSHRCFDDLLSSESHDTFLVFTSMCIDFKSGLQVLTITCQLFKVLWVLCLFAKSQYLFIYIAVVLK